MEDKYVQAIRYKLQKRIRRLNSINYQGFPYALRSFFGYLEDSAILAGIRDELLVRAASLDAEATAKQIFKGETLYGTTELETAAVGYHVLKLHALDPNQNRLSAFASYQRGSTKFDDFLEHMREMCLEPFYEYLDEHIDDQQAILYLLRRYKHRCEWFRSDQLRTLLQEDTQRGERSLAYDLYEFLHGEGIDLHIEPESASGIADFVAEQVGDERVVADTKVFWPEKSKGKTYLVSGFNQVYTYARDFNEPCAYLVVYKMSKEDVNFVVPTANTIFPFLSVNNKTIFFVVVDICDHGAPASKRGALKSIDITATDLIQAVEPNDAPSPSTGPDEAQPNLLSS